jgi:hypothetical protein
MHDIDLLFEPQDLNTAAQILEHAGYAHILNHVHFLSAWHQAQEERLFSELEPHGFHLPVFIKTLGAFTVAVELHHHLMPTVDAQQIDLIPVSGIDGAVRTLSPDFFLLHLCLHVHAHSQKAASSALLWYCDIVEFLQQYYPQNAPGHWKSFLALCQQFQVEEAVFQSLSVVHQLFKMYVPAEVVERGCHAQELLQKLFAAPGTNPDVHLLRLLLEQRKRFGVRYLWECLVPSKAFLHSRYAIHPQWLVYLYYPIRWGKALIRGGKLLKLLFTKHDRHPAKRT